jgi:hypothetical protein
MSEQIDVALGVLDHQLLDSDERHCGKVDDVDLEGLDGDSPRIKTILAGPPAWKTRGLVGRLAAPLVRGRMSHIEWSEVVKVDSAVHLRSRAGDYVLGRGDDRARRWIDWIPGAK